MQIVHASRPACCPSCIPTACARLVSSAFRTVVAGVTRRLRNLRTHERAARVSAVGTLEASETVGVGRCRTWRRRGAGGGWSCGGAASWGPAPGRRSCVAMPSLAPVPAPALPARSSAAAHHTPVHCSHCCVCTWHRAASPASQTNRPALSHLSQTNLPGGQQHAPPVALLHICTRLCAAGVLPQESALSRNTHLQLPQRADVHIQSPE